MKIIGVKRKLVRLITPWIRALDGPEKRKQWTKQIRITVCFEQRGLKDVLGQTQAQDQSQGHFSSFVSWRVQHHA